ncbi:MAG TPA: hypothetical protein VHX49_13240 [Candidatus Acidoferrales bacterium]|nr:hypothetical protein [Candidatus Acidoferrales bacterium]
METDRSHDGLIEKEHVHFREASRIMQHVVPRNDASFPVRAPSFGAALRVPMEQKERLENLILRRAVDKRQREIAEVEILPRLLLVVDEFAIRKLQHF